MECEQLEIKDILAYQEDINTHYMGEKITVEQDHIHAEIFYKKIPTKCPLADDFKQRTLDHLDSKNTKFDTVFSACYRLRVLLAEKVNGNHTATEVLCEYRLNLNKLKDTNKYKRCLQMVSSKNHKQLTT
jgi:hypothetical protein